MSNETNEIPETTLKRRPMEPPPIAFNPQPTDPPIQAHDRGHTKPLADLLLAAKLIDQPWQVEKYAFRLRGTVNHPRIWVRHPKTADPLDATYEDREHELAEGVALLADPNGPEAQLRERGRAIAAQAETRRQAEAARAAEALRERVQARWSATKPALRALWLVAARTKDPKTFDDQNIRTHAVKELIVKHQRSLLAALAVALTEAESDQAPDDVLGLPDFNT